VRAVLGAAVLPPAARPVLREDDTAPTHPNGYRVCVQLHTLSAPLWAVAEQRVHWQPPSARAILQTGAASTFVADGVPDARGFEAGCPFRFRTGGAAELVRAAPPPFPTAMQKLRIVTLRFGTARQ
jgi:hypothetical protein